MSTRDKYGRSEVAYAPAPTPQLSKVPMTVVRPGLNHDPPSFLRRTTPSTATLTQEETDVARARPTWAMEPMSAQPVAT